MRGRDCECVGADRSHLEASPPRASVRVWVCEYERLRNPNGSTFTGRRPVRRWQVLLQGPLTGAALFDPSPDDLRRRLSSWWTDTPQHQQMGAASYVISDPNRCPTSLDVASTTLLWDEVLLTEPHDVMNELSAQAPDTSAAVRDAGPPSLGENDLRSSVAWGEILYVGSGGRTNRAGTTGGGIETCALRQSRRSRWYPRRNVVITTRNTVMVHTRSNIRRTQTPPLLPLLLAPTPPASSRNASGANTHRLTWGAALTFVHNIILYMNPVLN